MGATGGSNAPHNQPAGRRGVSGLLKVGLLALYQSVRAPVAGYSNLPQTGTDRQTVSVGGETTRNPILELRVADLEKQKKQLEEDLEDLRKKSAEEEGKLLKDKNDLREKLERIEGSLSDRDSEIENLRKSLLFQSVYFDSFFSLKTAESELRDVEDRVATKHRTELDQQAKRHSETIDRLNLIISEKENIIQTEIRGASKRLQEREERALEEQRSLVKQWEERVAETEAMYRNKLVTIETDNRTAIEAMRQVSW
eukprot:sb/3468620/